MTETLWCFYYSIVYLYICDIPYSRTAVLPYPAIFHPDVFAVPYGVLPPEGTVRKLNKSAVFERRLSVIEDRTAYSEFVALKQSPFPRKVLVV